MTDPWNGPHMEFILPQSRLFGRKGDVVPIVVLTLPLKRRLRFLLDGKIVFLAEIVEAGYDTRIRFGQFRVRNAVGHIWRRLRG